MSQNFKVLFYLKMGKEKTKPELPVYVRVTIEGKRAEWSVQRKWTVSKWDQNRGRAMGPKDQSEILNKYLDTVEANIFEIQRKFALRQEPVSANQVKAEILFIPKEKKHSLMGVYDYHNQQVKEQIGLEYSAGTYRMFKSTSKNLQSFLQWKYTKPDVGLKEVNHKFITDFEFYLKTVKKMQHNTAMGNIKKLKKIVRICISNDWLDKDPFRSYTIRTKESHRHFLTKEELKVLAEASLPTKRLDQTRDIFLFSCYTGLAYSDVIGLLKKNIAVGIDGELWVFTTRTKTGTSSRIPLLPVPRMIIHKYESDPEVANTERLLPFISNQKINYFLKAVCDVCGFCKNVSFHCSRHTFATSVALTNGIPIETLSKMLGHKSIRTTQIYGKVLDTKVSEDMKQLREKLA